jgi:CheY-like chemotaxis protein
VLVGSGEQFRILVAEDDDSFLAALGEVVGGDPRFRVIAAARNGEECVDLVRRLDPDAVVVDIEMPVMDGVEATREVRALSPSLPVVAISGHDYEERVLEIRTAGANDYVRKARVGEDLCEALAALLDD